MHILIIGASGFIGTHITHHLLAQQHKITICVRDIRKGKQLYPQQSVIACDFLNDTDPTIWEPRLKSIDVVINCVGILETTPSAMQAIHVRTPCALFQACSNQSIKLIHISALGADQTAPTDYATSKFHAESTLMKMDFNWCILRPSLVYCYGSYGGTSLIRALASLPFFIPVVGSGKQPFSPIHMQDLCEVVRTVVESNRGFQQTLNVVGPEAIPYEHILIKYRQWLGFRRAKIIHVPTALMKKFTFFMQALFPELPVNNTALEMLDYGNQASSVHCAQVTGIHPKKMDERLLLEPSHVQDRWHAKLYFLGPLLKITLAMVWIFSGVLPLITSAKEATLSILNSIPLTSAFSIEIFYFSCALDILLGLALFSKKHIKLTLLLQAGMILSYTAFITCLAPQYWLDPFGCVLKNLPIFISTLISLTLQDQR